MRRPRVFLTRRIPEAGLRLVLDICDAEIWPHETPPPRASLLQGVRRSVGLLALLTDPIDGEVMDAAPALKVISNCAVGVDNIDVEAATARNIPVGNTPEVLTDATADLTFALLLAAARHIVPGVEYVKAGKWKTWNLQLLLGADLRGRTLGIVGFGRIGRAVARRAKGFGMRVIYWDPTPADTSEAEPVGLEALLRESDFVCLHVPLTSDTRHLINEETLSTMKPTAVLVNTSRGPVVDHDALYRALRDHRIFAAGLDVTEPEPLNLDSPLLQLDNCIVLPHLGSASKWTRDEMARLAAENLLAGLRGSRLPHCVNPEVYDR
jgi:lactate dehydrogenase-like 2-hydroxyacid dehydrogenase